MHVQQAELLLGVADGHLGAAGGDDQAGIADLAAGFGIERRLVQHNRNVRAGLRLGDRLAADPDGIDAAFGGFRVLAEEFAGAVFFANIHPDLLGRGSTGHRPALLALVAPPPPSPPATLTIPTPTPAPP